MSPAQDSLKKEMLLADEPSLEDLMWDTYDDSLHPDYSTQAKPFDHLDDFTMEGEQQAGGPSPHKQKQEDPWFAMIIEEPGPQTTTPVPITIPVPVPEPCMMETHQETHEEEDHSAIPPTTESSILEPTHIEEQEIFSMDLHTPTDSPEKHEEEGSEELYFMAPQIYEEMKPRPSWRQ
jgi:hypothetical protein